MVGDMKTAKIHVSVMGDAKQEKLSLLGLQNSAGFLQSRIADRIDTRYTPRLSFELDKGVKNSLEVPAMGWLSIIADPTGAALGLWQPKTASEISF